MKKSHIDRKPSNSKAEILTILPVRTEKVSFDGLRLEVHSTEMTRRKDTDTYKLTVISEQETLVLKAFPRWEKENSEKSGVGFRVFNAPRDWYRFVMDS